MRPFEDYNPFVHLVYFVSCSAIVMFFLQPVTVVLSLLGALSLFFVRRRLAEGRSHLYSLALFLVMALLNPLFNHNGATVLLLINHNPITLEAVFYGIFAAAMLLAVLYWFRTFSQIMSSDKLLYLFGGVSPKLALILSMALRYVPLFAKQAKRVNDTQRAMGLYREENLIDNTRAGARVFSVMVTWGLENGIVTADSMSARGYGVGKRTQYTLYRFYRTDVLLLCTTLLLLSIVVVGGALGALDMQWYPTLRLPRTDALALVTYVAYALLSFLPTILEIGERARWNCLQSRI